MVFPMTCGALRASAYDASQHLFTCSASLRSDPARTIRSFSDLLGLEDERVRLWTFARTAAEPRGDWNNGDLVALARLNLTFVLE
jgi:streptomycin 6-kinase